MDDKKLEYFKRILHQKKTELKQTLELMDENGTAEQDDRSPQDASNYDNHPADMATELFLAEFNNGLRIHEESLLADTQKAIGRIEDGTYGICGYCGNEIDPERLRVLPDASLCIECERHRESMAEAEDTKTKGRPVEELVLDAPLGRKYLNKQEDDEHEGLDVLNDALKHGSSDTPQDMGGYHDYKDFYTNKTDNQGIVEDVEKVSNKQYKDQLAE